MNLLISYGCIAILLVLSLSACVYNNEEELYPQTFDQADSCGISSVSYANDVVPILQSNCFVCHSVANAPFNGSGIVLEGYSNIKILVNSGRLRGAVNREAGFVPMPRGSAKLADCILKVINIWIEDGSPDN